MQNNDDEDPTDYKGPPALQHAQLVARTLRDHDNNFYWFIHQVRLHQQKHSWKRRVNVESVRRRYTHIHHRIIMLENSPQIRKCLIEAVMFYKIVNAMVEDEFVNYEEMVMVMRSYID